MSHHLALGDVLTQGREGAAVRSQDPSRQEQWWHSCLQAVKKRTPRELFVRPDATRNAA